MARIKARPYGNSNVAGAPIWFDIVDELPKVGELFDEETVLKVESEYMDPENRWSDDRMSRYGFYRVETEWEDRWYTHYVAIESEDYTEWLEGEDD